MKQDTVVDAAKYSCRGNWSQAICVIYSKRKELCSATVRTDDTNTAEKAAATLATSTIAKTQNRIIIITDSQAACRNCTEGPYFHSGSQNTPEHSRPKEENQPGVSFMWTPGHGFLEGNMAADANAQGHSHDVGARLLLDRSPKLSHDAVGTSWNTTRLAWKKTHLLI